MRPYEILEHTADIGLRIYGRDLGELFRHAAEGLFSLVTDLPHFKSVVSFRRHSSLVSETVRLEGTDAGDLFLKWLRELLFLFSAKQLIFWRFEFQKLGELELEALVTGSRFDPRVYEQKYELKAVTYHQFKIERQADGWVAEVIFDI